MPCTIKLLTILLLSFDFNIICFSLLIRNRLVNIKLGNGVTDNDFGGDQLDYNGDHKTHKNSTRFVARVMYDGTKYRGWQIQDDLRTVQKTLCTTFSARFNDDIRVVGASRTDHGVHARGQVIHFDIPWKSAENLDFDYFEYSMNRALPDDIRIFNVSLAPAGTRIQMTYNEPFHATGSAVSKLYIYRFCCNKFVDPMRRRYCSHVYLPLDIELLEQCLQTFVGTYDFISFANRIEHTKKDFKRTKNKHEFTTVRTIHSIRLLPEDMEGYYRIEFHLESALYQMIRNLVGTSLHVACGRGFDLEHLKGLLRDAPGRMANKARPAPPEGLTLEHVYYDNY